MANHKTAIADDITEVKDMIRVGFSTKAAQKRAAEIVGMAFEKINRELSVSILAQDKTPELDDAYWNKPSYIHQFKDAKHGDWYDMVNSRDAVNELLSLRNEIKKTEVVKTLGKAAARKAAVAKSGGMAVIENAVAHLKVDAVARAEEDAVKIIARIRKELEANDMNADLVAPDNKGHDAGKYQMINSITTTKVRRYGMPKIVEFDDRLETRFITHAKEDAAAQYESFVYKLASKIGDVETATLEGNHVWGESFLTVTKPDNIKEVWKTHMIVNVSKLGKLFNQYPTRKMK